MNASSTMPMSFTAYLRKRFAARDTISGDFARDWLRPQFGTDPSPEDPASEEALVAYLVRQRACAEALRAGKRLYRSWRRSIDPNLRTRTTHREETHT